MINVRRLFHHPKKELNNNLRTFLIKNINIHLQLEHIYF